MYGFHVKIFMNSIFQSGMYLSQLSTVLTPLLRATSSHSVNVADLYVKYTKEAYILYMCHCTELYIQHN